MMLLAQIPQEIKEPGFAQWLFYLFIAWWMGKEVVKGVLKVAGKEGAAKREITGTVTTEEPTKHAEQKEVDALRGEMKALQETNTSQHLAAQKAGEQRVRDLSKVIDAEVEKLDEKIQRSIDSIKDEMRDGFTALAHKLDPTLILSGQHAVILEDLKPRFELHLAKHSEQVGKIHERINDAINRIAELKSCGPAKPKS